MSKIFRCNGKDCDLSTVLPLKLGDWKRLEQKGLDQSKLTNLSMTDLCELVHYVLHKANPDVTMDDVEQLTPSEIMPLAEMIGEEGTADRPT